MLELGENGAGAASRRSRSRLTRPSVDLVFACGPMMRQLFDGLPPARQGAWAPTLGRSSPRRLLDAVRAGDVVMIKGSLGTRMAPLVEALTKANDTAQAGQGQAAGRRQMPSESWMLYELVNFSDQIGILNVFRYITFRTGGAIMTALLFVFLFGPGHHRPAARQAGQGPADPRGRPASRTSPRWARRPWAGS